MAAAYRIRRQEEFHALDVSGRRAIALIHIAASDPLGAGRHPDLVTHAVVTDRRARGVAAMEKVVARERRIVPAWIACAVVDAVMPVIIVIGIHSVPPAIVRLQRVMRPANAGVCTRHNNSLPGEPLRPDLRRVCVIDARLNRCRTLEKPRRLNHGARLRETIVDVRIAFNAGHIWPRRQLQGNIEVTFYPNQIHYVIRAMRDIALAQPCQEWPLGCLRFIP